jgi:hypothetical protein
MEAVGVHVRAVRAGGRHPLQRPLHATRQLQATATSRFLVDLERAEPRHPAGAGVTTRTKIEASPGLYRGLVDAAWSAFAASGHGRDTILIGEIAPAGVTTGVGLFNNMPPLRFLRALYCVGADDRPLRGTAARERDCPAGAVGTASFAKAHPGLFHATGFADHPYPQGLPPNEPTPNEPDYAELAKIDKLEQTLDTVQRAYGSHTKFPIWSTEDDPPASAGRLGVCAPGTRRCPRDAPAPARRDSVRAVFGRGVHDGADGLAQRSARLLRGPADVPGQRHGPPAMDAPARLG